MSKFILFFVAIIIGTLAILSLLNPKPSTSTLNTNILISPTAAPLSLDQPTEQVAKETKPSITSESKVTEKVINAATIKTAKGDIVLSFYQKDAPNTVKNFIDKAKSGFYNNLTFHRVEDWVIQGGDPLGNGTGGGNMPVEFNSKPFVVGSLGVASRGDGKVQNDAQFFITKTDASWLNGQYTNFGIVTKGMDVVEKIETGDKILEIVLE